MSKILTIALNEYRNVVFTKSFLIGLLLPPLFYGGMILLMIFVRGTTDLDDRKLVIVDHSGVLFEDLASAVSEYNRGDAVYNADGDQIGPKIVVESYDGGNDELGALELELSERVRADEAFGFVIIGGGFDAIDGRENDFIRYYSEAPTEQDIPRWVERTARRAVENRRLSAEGLDQNRVRQIFSHNQLERFGLAELSPTGEIIRPRKENFELAFFAPIIAVMMLFFGIQMATPVLLNSVIEEKMQRIAEVLLSSVTATQLLWGKLLAGSAIGLTFSSVYVATGAFALWNMGRWDYLPDGLFVFFFLFLIVSLLTFGSLLAAISASCQDLKDSQNMAGSVMMLIVVPLILAASVVSATESVFAITVSFIPPFSPMMMIVRLGVPPGPPLWQPILALVINLAFAVVVVGAAARIFRIGILAQGKTPGWRQLVRWALRK